MIICLGEALIDMIPVAGPDGSSCLRPVSGGAIFNTAIALGRLGRTTAMITGLSSDMFGRQLKADLVASNVDCSHAIMSDRPTTLAFVELVDGSATYHFYDEGTAGRMLQASDITALPPADAFYFGGISLCALPAADTYAALATTAASSGVVMVDPNIRPGFIDDEAGYRARLTRILGVADIVKLSDEDLEWLVPDHADERERIARLLPDFGRAGAASLVVITRGGEGATAYLRIGNTVEVASKRVKVADTVGAGDTFNAGLLASLSEAGVLTKPALRSAGEAVVRSAMDFAASVAAVTVSRTGANPPWKHELEEQANPV